MLEPYYIVLMILKRLKYRSSCDLNFQDGIKWPW